MKSNSKNTITQLLQQNQLQEARALLEQDLSVLRACDLRNISLSGADLSSANICGTDLRQANLSGANLRRALYDDETKWPEGFDHTSLGAIGPNANSVDTNLSNLNLSDASLSGIDLSNSWLYSTDLSRANLSGANLEGADLEDALYDDATQWPEGFDPVSAGAVLEEAEE